MQSCGVLIFYPWLTQREESIDDQELAPGAALRYPNAGRLARTQTRAIIEQAMLEKEKAASILWRGGTELGVRAPRKTPAAARPTSTLAASPSEGVSLRRSQRIRDLVARRDTQPSNVEQGTGKIVQTAKYQPQTRGKISKRPKSIQRGRSQGPTKSRGREKRSHKGR